MFGTICMNLHETMNLLLGLKATQGGKYKYKQIEKITVRDNKAAA
ncbi:MAG: hypothetical protein E6778_08165 [Niallia nealsonii]|nr:hypothetical protein [Niallia nealsonii]